MEKFMIRLPKPARWILLLLGMSYHYSVALAQDNPYKIDNQLYQYYRQCEARIKSREVLKMADTLFQRAKEKKDVKAQCLAINLKPEHYYFTGNIDSLLQAKETIASFARNTPYTQYVFGAWNRIITYYLLQENYPLALEQVEKYQQEALRLNDAYGIGQGYTKMGNVYSQQGMPEAAIEQYKLAIEYYMRTGKEAETYYAYTCIGRCLIELGRYEEAEENLLRSLKLCPSSYSVKNVYLSLFRLYTLQSDRKSDKAETIKKTLDSLFRHKQLVSDTHYNDYHLISAKYYREKGNPEKALFHVRQVKNPLNRLLEKSQIYATQGNYRQAYGNLQKWHLLTDSLHRQKNTALLASYNARFHNQNLELERNQLRLQNTEISTRLQKRMLWGIIIFLVLASGFSVLYAFSFRKMSHRLQIEKNAAEKARLQAEKADRLKTLFLQNLNHEIRTPLNAILGFNEVLNHEEAKFSAEEREQMLEMLKSNGSLLLQIINQSVDLSCLDSGNLKISKVPVHINELCHRILQKAEKNLPEDVKLEYQEMKEETKLTTDAGHLERILTHLLENACKYTKQGSIRLSCTSDNNQICFTVTDTGCGIAPENAEKIFQRFEKLDNFKPGAGLGLSICRGIAELLGGRLHLDPTYTNGARFIFEHPL